MRSQPTKTVASADLQEHGVRKVREKALGDACESPVARLVGGVVFRDGAINGTIGVKYITAARHCIGIGVVK